MKKWAKPVKKDNEFILIDPDLKVYTAFTPLSKKGGKGKSKGKANYIILIF